MGRLRPIRVAFRMFSRGSLIVIGRRCRTPDEQWQIETNDDDGRPLCSIFYYFAVTTRSFRFISIYFHISAPLSLSLSLSLSRYSVLGTRPLDISMIRKMTRERVPVHMMPDVRSKVDSTHWPLSKFHQFHPLR